MSFERVVLSNLVTKEAYTRRVLPFLRPEYFRDTAEREVFNYINEFVSKYNVNPTKESLAINISNSPMNEGLFEEVMEVVKGLEPDNNHVDWLIDETEKMVKNNGLYLALQKALDIADGEAKDLDKNAIPGILMEALGLSFDTHVGHDYFESAEEQWEYKHSLESKIAFNIPIFNKVTKGGVGKKTLNVVAAPINGGKSVHLVQQAADNVANGLNAVYFSMEMGENEVRERVDCVLMDMTFDQVQALEKQQYLSKVNAIKQKTQGKLIVKEFPPGGAHVGHFRHTLQELRIKKNFVPDVIIIDYLTICASARLPASARGNTNTYFTAVAEELRALGKEFNCPIWTAVQLDRGSQGANDAGMSNVALAIGISATADFMFVLLAPEELYARKQMIAKVIKNRYSSYKGIKFLIGMDPDRQKFFEVDMAEQAVVMDEDELKSMDIPNKIPEGRNSINSEKMKEWSF